MDLLNNLNDIQKKIKKAAEKSGRISEDIKLIAVTKTVDFDIMNEAIRLGVDNIGENKVQEIQRKYDLIDKNIKVNWHLIGHLQSNKVKYIIDKIDLIHSLDRISLAKEIHKRARERDVYSEVLIQVNIAEEETKFGLKGEEVKGFIESILKYDRIKIKGLMTMAPFSENPENVRYVFRQLKGLSNDINAKGYPQVDMKYLSMGMTNDYEIAIEEGSNMVRIGTGIFGKRK